MKTKQTKIIGYENNIPIIQAEWRKDFLGGLKFYCEFCKIIHHHGRGAGHRVAHCHNSKSPFDKTGYTLALPEEKL